MYKFYRLNWSVLILTSLFLLPETTFAATKAEPEPELFGGGQWFLALLSLVFVVCLAYWATRFLAGRFGNLPSRHIKVAESLCLGPNRHLYLLLANNQVLLVGSSEHGISLLKEYNDPAFFEEMQMLSSQSQVIPTGKFKELLAPLINNFIPNVTNTTTNENINQNRTTELKERLTGSLEKIRSWRTKDRG